MNRFSGPAPQQALWRFVAALPVLALAAGAAAAPVACKVSGEQYVDKGTARKTLDAYEGTPCRWVFRFGGTNPPDTWKITRAPVHAKITFVDRELEFQPEPGFTGTDEFALHVFGSAPGGGNYKERNGEIMFAVTVAPKP